MTNSVLMLVPPPMAVQLERQVQELLKGKRFPGPFFYSFQHMMARLADDRMQLWFAFKKEGEPPHLMAVTELAEYDAGKVLRFCLVAGSDIRSGLAHLGKIEQWGVFQGAFCSEITTRPKLARVLARYGYRVPLTTIYKPLGTIQ